MNFFKILSSRNLNHLLLALPLALALVVGLAAWLAPAPQLTIEYNDTTVEVFAEKAWIVLPNGCLQIRWKFDGELPIHVDGREWHESGEQQFCPTMSATSPKVEFSPHLGGEYRSYTLTVFYLPEFVANLVGVAAIPFLALFGLQYLWINDVRQRPAFKAVVIVTLILMLCITLLRLSGRELTMEAMLVVLRNLFSSAHWHFVGVLLTGFLYIPLVLQAMWKAISKRQTADVFAIIGFMSIVVLLYLPFGFATVAQWDGWTFRAYLESMSWPRMETELTLRPFALAPAAFAKATGSESFVNFNIVHASLLWAKLVMLYGILRQIRIPCLYAFLVTILFFVYPADARLLSVQSINLQFSFFALLTAIYLALCYTRTRTRPYLVGTWLALCLCVGLYESGFGLILVVPLIWWRRFRKMAWRNLNLSFIWYIVPASKVVYLLLLLASRRSFYQSGFFYSGSEIALGDLFSQTIGRLLEVYLRSFAFGWSEALHSVKQNPWLPLAVFILGLLGALAWLIWRTDKRARMPGNRQLGLALVTGLLLVLPSVAVLIWIDYYNNELRGLYLYIPVAAAIALFCLIALLTSPIASNKLRNATIAGLCLLMMLPALSRLLLQHEHYVTSANNKARILAQIAQLAPALESQTRVLVLSEMSGEEFQDKYIEAFTSSALGHALYVIYEGQGSGRGSICPSMENCFPLLHRQEHLKNTIVFLLDRDLNLELVKEPSAMLEAFAGIEYDLSRLYDADAPAPPRAYSMLGLSNE